VRKTRKERKEGEPEDTIGICHLMALAILAEGFDLETSSKVEIT
jgi:hypothetical protein